MKTYLDYAHDPIADLGDRSPRDIWSAGFDFAADIPRFNLDMLKNGMDEEEAKELAFDAWNEAQENKRQYSPFEITANVLNECADSERAWELFEEGIAAAFEHGWNVYVLREFTFSV